jgi:subtilase family serine protease
MRRLLFAFLLFRCPRRPVGWSGLLAVIGLLASSLTLVTGPRTARAAILIAPASGPRLARIGAAPRVPAGATALGSVPAASPIQATIALTPRDPAALAAYAQAVATPGSAVYRQYLSVAQFADRFGAAPREVAAVQAALRAQGLEPSAPSANRLELSVTASAGVAATAFATSLERFRLTDGRRAVVSLTAPAVPASVAGLVQGIVGLSSLSTPAPAALIRRPDARRPVARRPVARRPVARRPVRLVRQGRLARLARLAPGASPASAGVPGEASACSAAGASGAYTAGQIASAYGFSGLYAAGDGGAGQTIALFELEPYAASDIAAYQSCYGTSASVSQIAVDGGAGSGSGAGEAALDIEDLIGLAPQASILVYEGPNTGAGAYDTYARMISDDRAKVISTSWGACEDPSYASSLQAEASLFEEAAAQGQTVLAAAGDSGADDCQTGAGAAVDDPASQPDVTGVGGTTMTPGVDAPSETVWNSTWAGGAGAGGGGVSSIWPRPSYQTASALAQSSTTCGSGQTACREVPDVSADADVNTGYAIYYRGGWYDFGGTSAAAPTWAALIALTDAWSGCAAPLGFLNPGLYQAAQSGSATVFNDVTSGNNSFDGVTGYSAAAGYDMASGWGSPRGSALAGALCGTTAPAASGTGGATAPAGGSGGGSGTTGTTGTTTTGTGTTSTGPTGTGTTGTATTGTATTGSGTPTATGTTGTGTTPPTAPSTSSTPTVAVAVAATLRGTVGRRLTIVPRAVDTASLRLSWRAENLPGGLSIDPSSGMISGRPLRAAQAAVTLVATDSAGATGQATVRLIIAGTAVISRRVTFPRRGRVQIAIGARAGRFSGGIRRLVLTVHSRLVHLPGGSALRRLLGLHGAGGRRLAARVRRDGNSVIVSLRSPVSLVALRLAVAIAPAPRGLVATAAGGRHPVGLVTVTAT